MTPIAWTGAIIAATMVLFVWNRAPVTVVAVGSALALWATGIVTLPEALAGFGDTSVVFIASLFVVSSALDATGVTAWVGQKLIGDPGAGGFQKLLLTLMLLAAGLTALISANGAVAALLPVASVAAVRLSVSPSRVLLPLAFAAHAGSNLVLTGAPKNVLVSDALVDAGLPGFGYLEFAFVGVPLVIGTVIVVRLLGASLLPERSSRNMPADLSRHARVLVEQYGLAAGTYKLRMREGSPLSGRSPAEPDLLPQGLRLVSTLAGADGGPVRGPLAPGDMLMIQGEPAAAAAYAEENELSFRDLREDGGETLLSRSTGLAEVVIPPRSALVGRRVFPGMITTEGDLVILAIQRNGQDVAEGGVDLAPGDTLLLQGTWKALDQRLGTPEVLIVDSPDLVRRQAVPLGAGARIALAVMGGMVLLLATGLVPPAVAGLLAAGVLLASGVVSLDAAHRAINWTTVILVGAMMPLSLAMDRTGAAQLLAEGLVAAAGPLGPTALLAGLFILTATLGQIMSNTATTLIVIPVALAAAAGMGVSPRPVMMSLCVAGAASFMTPVATSTNLMVMGPGGYKFGDYWRLGAPLMALYFVVAVFLVPVVWPF
jgi:di/tricarboxylate transporter